MANDIGVTSYPFRATHRLDLDAEFGPLYLRDTMTKVELPYGGQAWLAVRYEHVRTVLVDKRFSRSMANDSNVARLSSEVLPVTSMMAMDGEEHLKVRRALAPHFTNAAVERMRTRVATLTDGLIDAVLAVGPPVDLVMMIAQALPVQVICAVLGIAESDHDHFVQFANALRQRDIDPATRDEARRKFESFVAGLVTDCRQGSGGDGLLTALAEETDPERALSNEQMVDAVVALLVGGVGSPATFIASGIVLLMRQPEIYSALGRGAVRREDVVEELLRLVPIGVGGGFVRLATEDGMIGRTQVRRGDAVLPAMIAANRDPGVFNDPELIRLDRANKRHLGMGAGAHHCVGSQLARLQMQEVLRSITSRLPGLTLALPEGQLRWREGLVVRELESLPVTW